MPPAVLSPWGTRRIRLTSGLVLFAYVSTHLLNHALGNVSVAAMETGLAVQKWIWQGVLGTIALYAALTVHLSLGLWALYQRRHYGWKRGEVLQLILGLAIPPLLANHILVTRIALRLYGIEKGYPQELYSFWVASPTLGVLQVTVLLVAWTHGCLGLYFWLRLKPFFSKFGPILLSLALLIPTLALLGFFQGGRTILAIVNDPAWRAVNLTPGHLGIPAQVRQLRIWKEDFLWGTPVVLALILAARGVRTLRQRGAIRLAFPTGPTVRAPLGFSVLEASLRAKLPIACVCGGRARCSTCRVRVLSDNERLPPPSEVERAVLQRVSAGPHVRLACQLRPLEDIAVVPLFAPTTSAVDVRENVPPHAGEERVVVVMVVDMRDSMRLAQTRMPYDAVFVIDRFIDAVGSAISEAGGRPNQFRGDGLLAMFGIDCDPSTACRQAIRAGRLIALRIKALNAVLATYLSEPIRFGIGIDSGPVIVGEIGYGKSRVLTALGDTANLAARLEGLCKGLQVEVIMSETVYELSGLALTLLSRREVEVRGRAAPVTVRLAERAEDLAEASLPAGAG
jgi:adenylate cyclase